MDRDGVNSGAGSSGAGSSGAERAAGSDVVLYWRPLCSFCLQLRFGLLFTRLRYSRRFTRVNIWKSPDAAAFVRSVADGNETVPTVTVAGRPMVNPSLRQLLRAVRESDASRAS
ncbi:glutaredoxin domain-containing protein [Kitasatospora sp. NPDC094011]|uniref:glutaredoxin domain-containing protein n=1 Tax=Kitasatospora sp. NPDC094011 TaxID=3364090 RepID=UPI00381C8B3B